MPRISHSAGSGMEDGSEPNLGENGDATPTGQDDVAQRLENLENLVKELMDKLESGEYFKFVG
jgi:hypothetical protein